MQKESTKDILTIFSDLVNVKFKKGEVYKIVKDQWCLTENMGKHVFIPVNRVTHNETEEMKS